MEITAGLRDLLIETAESLSGAERRRFMANTLTKLQLGQRELRGKRDIMHSPGDGSDGSRPPSGPAAKPTRVRNWGSEARRSLLPCRRGPSGCTVMTSFLGRGADESMMTLWLARCSERR
jgi:hypothetical protein